MNRSLIRKLLFWSVPLFLLALVLRRVDLEEAGRVLASIKPSQIGLLLLLNIVIFLLFALRWWIFVRGSGGSVPFFSLARYRLTAFGITYFTFGPQFGGEPYQVIALAQERGLSPDVAISSVSLDKLAELLANFSFLIIGLGVTVVNGYLPSTINFVALPLAFLILLLPLAYLLMLRLGRKPITALASLASMGVSSGRTRLPDMAQQSPWLSWSSIRNHTDGLVVKILPGLDASEEKLREILQRRPFVFIIGLGLAALTWLLVVGEYHLAMSYLGLPLSLVQSIVLLTAARLAYLLPSPSGLGAFEASQVIALGAFGLGPATAISISLLVRTRDILFGATGLLLAGRMMK